MFVAAADEGSFSAAGRKLGRVQSAVSHGIAKLEEALGVTLFDRSHRRPTLSAEGQSLLIEARILLDQMQTLHSRAASIRAGLEAEVSLVVDACFPIDHLVRLCQWFQQHYSEVSLRVATEALGAVAARVHAGDFQLGVTGPEGWNRKHFRVQAAYPVKLIPVIATNHALARRKGMLSDTHLRNETQIVLSERSNATQGVDFGVLSERLWRVADLWTKLAFLRAGLGWGTMPEPMVKEDIANKKLSRIRPKSWQGHEWRLPLFIISDRKAAPLGPAGKALMRQIAHA